MKCVDLWKRVSENQNTIELLGYLFDRWQDEFEYEDVSEYLKKVQEVIPEVYEISELEFVIKAKGSDGELQIHFDYEGEGVIIFPVIRN